MMPLVEEQGRGIRGQGLGKSGKFSSSLTPNPSPLFVGWEGAEWATIHKSGDLSRGQ